MPNPWNTTQQPKRNEPEGFLQCRRPGSILGSGGSPGEGNGNPLQYFCLGNPMDGGAWRATVHGVAKSRPPQNVGSAGRTSLASRRAS